MPQDQDIDVELHDPLVASRLIELTVASSGPIREAINPENTLVYVGVNGRELEEGLSYDNHQQAMVIADLCLEFLRHGVDQSRISVMAAYRPHVNVRCVCVCKNSRRRNGLRYL